jgi:hypothetical protein
VLLGNDTQNVFGARHSVSAHYDRHERVFTPNFVNDIEGYGILADDREVTAGHITEGNAGVGALKAAS